MLTLFQYKQYKIAFIINILHFVLKNNYIIYKHQLYLQTKGTAMGTPCAVVYACLFLGHIEMRMYKIYNHVPPFLLFKRYIDDIFAIFPDHITALLFMSLYNSLHPDIQLTIQYNLQTFYQFRSMPGGYDAAGKRARRI
jgi:hypothetical protein